MWYPNELLFALLFLVAKSISEDCSCGYATSNISATFMNAFETDFLHVGNITKDTMNAWVPQAYISTARDLHGPYGKLAQSTNIVTNPVNGIYNWGGPGIHGSIPGLQLWVRSSLVTLPSSPSPFVPIAEIVSARSDILYGSFRVALRSSSVNGTCAAFFTYFNDTSEIDVEILSRQQVTSTDQGNDQGRGKVNFVIQSPETAVLGYVPPSSTDFGLMDLGDSAAATYNEYRIDWLPDRVEFLVNGQSLEVMTENVPALPARLHLIHWSDGNPGWSGGPPDRDAVVTVSYVKAYFNSSAQQQQDGGCKARTGVCVVPDVTAPPDPMGPNGNVTGRTFFFANPLVAAPKLTRKGEAGKIQGWGLYPWLMVLSVAWLGYNL